MERVPTQAMHITQFLLLLHSIPDVGDRTLSHALRYLVQQRLSPADLLAFPARRWQRDLQLSESACNYLFENREALLQKSLELEKLRFKSQVHLLYQGSASYPELLDVNEEVPPALVYARGNLGLIDENRSFTFTVIASNKPTSHHLDRIDALVTDMANAGGTVVTGHDRLPYQRAALAAHRIDRPIIYVFDKGLRNALGADFSQTPFASARIYEVEFNTDLDLALSPFRLDDHSLSFNLPKRDRLIFSLSDIVIAQDVRSGGVMYTQCQRILKQGRPLYVASDGREGNALLLQQGAKPLPTGEGWIPRLFEELR